MIWRNDMTKNPNDELTNERIFSIPTFLLFRFKIKAPTIMSKESKRKAKLRFNLSKSYFFNIVLPGIDEGTDVFSAIKHFM